jgi:hygromycin-B 4-O-kinase
MTRAKRDRRSVGREAARARARTREIIRSHFGSVPARLVSRAGGLSNFVFEFRVGAEEYVIRLNPDPTKLQTLLKQKWAMDAARKAAVPTPRVLEVGHEAGGASYMVMQKVEGRTGSQLPAPERLALLAELGRLARRLHTVRTRGFGPVFDWSENALSRRATWAEFLECDLEAERRLRLLAKHRLLPAPALARLRRRTAEMRRWRMRPVLHHGDLRLKNVLVHAKGGIAALVDWDDAISAPAPFYDLAIALHDLWADEREAFLEGYGLSPAAFARIVPYLRVLNALQYAPVVEDLVARGERRRLEWCRLRLQGDLDVHGWR